MASRRQQQRRAAEFIEPFRVKPGSKVNLAKDFDPRFKAGVKKKKEGVALLEDRGANCCRSTRLGSPHRTSGGCSWFCRRSMRRARTARSAT